MASRTPRPTAFALAALLVAACAETPEPLTAAEPAGETEARVGAAEAERDSASAGLQGTSEGVALDSATVSLDVGRDVALLRLAIEHVRWLEDMLIMVRARRDQGLSTDTDVAQVESRLARARATQAEALGNLRRSEAFYLYTVGRPPPGSDMPVTPYDGPAPSNEAAPDATEAPD